MAEELRELTVRLSLSADNFSRNIKSINQQIKQAEARFKEMGAGSKTFGTSVQGLTARPDDAPRTAEHAEGERCPV